jgi:hypothetical protein
MGVYGGVSMAFVPSEMRFKCLFLVPVSYYRRDPAVSYYRFESSEADF